MDLPFDPAQGAIVFVKPGFRRGNVPHERRERDYGVQVRGERVLPRNRETYYGNLSLHSSNGRDGSRPCRERHGRA